jgi:hypothetical protein
MLRRVAFRKALLAGAAGAVAWEIAARLMIWLDIPLFDLVRALGTMILGDVSRVAVVASWTGHARFGRRDLGHLLCLLFLVHL